MRYESENSINALDLLEEILKFKEIVILGEGYDGRNVEKIFLNCINAGTYLEIKPTVKYCLTNELAVKEISGCYSACELARHDNRDKVLIICSEFEIANREYVNLIKSDFGKIVKGKLLLNCWYQNVHFHISTDQDDMKKSDCDKDVEITEEDYIIRDYCRKLYEYKREEDYIRIIDYYSSGNNYLLAYDYCLRALCCFDDAKITNKKEQIEHIIEKRELTLLDYVNAMEKYIDITYYGRSGSVYFQSLLESHSGIITLPVGIIYYPYHSIYALYYSKRGYVEIGEIVDALDINNSLIMEYDDAIEIRVKGNNELYPHGYRQKYRYYVEAILNERMKKNRIIDEKFLIKVINLSHHLALGRDVDYRKGIPYILNHQHTNDIDMENKILNYFPDTTILCTIRNVVQNFGSNIATLLRKADFEVAGGKILDLFLYYAVHPIFKSLGNNCRILLVPLEKINTCPIELFHKILQRIDLEWEEILMQSTINGQKMYDRYGKNDAFVSGARITGISKKYDEYLDSFDRFRLEVLYYPILSKWNYPCPDFRDMEYIRLLSDVPFRFEQILRFQSVVEQNEYRKKIKRMVLYLIEHQKEMQDCVKDHILL